jgi:hypothetical protein
MSQTLSQSTRNIPRPKLDLFAHCAIIHSCLLPRRTRPSHHFPISRFLEEILVSQDQTLLQVPVLAPLKVPVLAPALVMASRAGSTQVRAILPLVWCERAI